MKKLITSTLMILIVFAMLGQTRADSIKVYFDLNRGLFDPALGDNASSMDSFIDKVRAAVCADDLDHIDIYGYASPDGPVSYNERLAKKRCDAIAAYISDRAGVSPQQIQSQSGGIAWDELRSLVASDYSVPDRLQVLDILDDSTLRVYRSGRRIIDERKKRLMRLDGGATYRWLLDNLFPQLRYALSISICRKSDSAEGTGDDTRVVGTQDIVIITDDILTDGDDYIAGENEYVDAVNTVIADLKAATDNTKAAEAAAATPPYHKLAIKTNLLYYAALMPNIELEWLVNRHWSVALEGNVAWWSNKARAKIYQLAIIDAEARRWIRPRGPWHGFYVGLFAGGGWYDFENGGPGYYGEGVMTGLSLGYMWPVSRNLSLEAGIGAGYMHTRYKEYQPLDGHHVYQRTKDLDYFGPLKVKFSLVWRLWDLNKPGRLNVEKRYDGAI